MALDDLHMAKSGLVDLVACLVQTIAETDPTFQERFLDRLDAAYIERRDNSEGDQRHPMEVLSWTRQMLTGFSFLSGPGDPFLSNYRPK